MIPRYRVTIERQECKACHYGQLWAIEGPDGVLMGTSYEEKADAELAAGQFTEIARQAYLMGYEDAARGEPTP